MALLRCRGRGISRVSSLREGRLSGILRMSRRSDELLVDATLRQRWEAAPGLWKKTRGTSAVLAPALPRHHNHGARSAVPTRDAGSRESPPADRPAGLLPRVRQAG